MGPADSKRYFMRRFSLLLVFAVIAASAPLGAQVASPAPEVTPTPEPAPTPIPKPPRPIPAIEHVLIISIDGLRPDRALYASMPNLRELLRAGSYTFWAKTTPNSITLPSHISMLTGVSPRKHGIEWNADLPLLRPIYPRVATIFEMATRNGLTSAMVAGKPKFATLNKPGTITTVYVDRGDQSDNDTVTRNTLELLSASQPDLIFVHFPDVDATGHGKGWGSPEQFAAIEHADVCLGQIFLKLREIGILEKTLIILSADHGGAGRSHGPDDARSRHIPWIAVGPGVIPGQDLTQFDELEVRTEDTAATACWALGLPIPDYFDGHPVKAAFQGP